MNFKPITVLLILGSVLGTLAKYRKTGDHFGNEEDSLSDFTAFTNTMISEWVQLFNENDAKDIALKYSSDVVWLHPVFGRITTQEGVIEAYEALFDIGATSVKATLLRSAYIGDNYAYVLLNKDFQDKDGQTVLVSEDLVLLRQLKEGGFQVMFKSSTYTDEKDEPKREFLRRMVSEML